MEVERDGGDGMGRWEEGGGQGEMAERRAEINTLCFFEALNSRLVDCGYRSRYQKA